MVLSSTKQSLENREVSLLAIVEIIVAVGMYWYIAYYFDFYWHIIISIGITPLLLLQSKKSIELCLKFFHTDKEEIFKEKSFRRIYFLILDLLITVGMFIAIYFMLTLLSTNDFINTYIEGKPFQVIFVPLMGMGIFVGASMVLSKENSGAEQESGENKIIDKIIENILFVLLVFPLGIGIGIGILIVTIIHKFFSVLLNIRLGYANIISNWIYNIFIQDIKKVPEIIIDIENENKIRDIYKISKLYEGLKSSDDFWARVTKFILFFTLYPSALFYRLSIKSTFWFYAPLMLIVKTPNLEKSQEIGKFLSEQYQTIWAWLRGLLAVGTLVAFITTYFQYYAFSEVSTIPFISIVSMLYLDFSSIELWKVFQLVVAFVTIGLLLYSNAIRVPAVANNISLIKDYRVMTIYYFNSLRNWFSLFYFTSAFIFLAYYFQVWEYPYMPHFMEDFLSNLIQYIRYKPFG